MNVDTDDNAALYSKILLELAGQASKPERLAAPDASASTVSVICGSKVTVDLNWDNAGRITAFGFESEACALTRAVLSVMKENIRGLNLAEIRQAGQIFSSFLDKGSPIPDGRWEKLGFLGNLRDYRARHPSMLLPFEAVEKAFAKKT